MFGTSGEVVKGVKKSISNGKVIKAGVINAFDFSGDVFDDRVIATCIFVASVYQASGDTEVVVETVMGYEGCQLLTFFIKIYSLVAIYSI